MIVAMGEKKYVLGQGSNMISPCAPLHSSRDSQVQQRPPTPGVLAGGESVQRPELDLGALRRAPSPDADVL